MRRTQSSNAPTTGFLQKKFFDDLENVVVRRLHVEAKSDEARADLRRKHGIIDERLLSELAFLGVTSVTLVAIRLIPLVQLAWADNHIDPKERKAVLKASKSLGIEQDSDAYVLLDHWLHKMPPSVSVDAWKRYIRGIMNNMSDVARERMVKLFKIRMLSVAEASRGYFGFGKVSSKKRRMIDGFMAALSSDALAHEILRPKRSGG